MHLNFALHLVMHWFIEALYPHRAYNHVVLCILIILPFYVDLNQQEHTSIYIYVLICISFSIYLYLSIYLYSRSGHAADHKNISVLH